MIIEVQNAMLDRLRAVFGNTIANYEAIPAGIDLDEQLKQRDKRLPALFVSFLGGQGEEDGAARIKGQFGVFAMFESKSEPTRRGLALPVIEIVAATLHGFEIDGVGSFELGDVQNLFAEPLDAKGLTLYAATFSIPLAFAKIADPAAHLAPFMTFHADYPAPGAPQTPVPLPDGTAPSDTVSLPGDQS